MLDERVWAEISLPALENNVDIVRGHLGGVSHMAVIKADAYGHGSVQVARVLQRKGVSYLAVACLSEAMELRQANIELPILILGYTPCEKLPYLMRYGLTQTVYDSGYGHALSEHVRARGGTLKIHIKADTGMNRLGVRTAEQILEIANLPGLEAEGLFTHLSSADRPDNPSVGEQVAAFEELRRSLIDINFPLTHCANSGGVLYYKESWFNMVRSGILLFGASCENGFRPVMHLRARVAQVKNVAAGECVSYDRTYKAERDIKIAVVCAGYADGYMRAFSNRAQAVCRGVRVPVVGRVCMDMLMLDVSQLEDVKAGDTVTLFGAHGLSASELALYGDTIPYEVLCAVSRRVPRVYSDTHGGNGDFSDSVRLWSPGPRIFGS